MDYFIRCKKLCGLTKYGSNQEVHPLLVRIQIYSNTVSNLLENHLAESTKAEIFLPWNLIILLLGIHPIKCIHAKVCFRMFIANVVASNLKLCKRSSTYRMGKCIFVCSYNDIWDSENYVQHVDDSQKHRDQHKKPDIKECYMLSFI